MCQVVLTSEDALTTRLLQATIHTLELNGIYPASRGGRASSKA
jgi:hypothetical protein